MNVPARILPKTGICWYGLQKIPGLLDAFTGEIEGVKEAQDIEYIHRMRVASRRLRAALPLFEPCFFKNEYRKWMREITQITRALGEARDADVQIAFLEKSLKKVQKERGLQEKPELGNPVTTEPAIRFLLSALQKKRDRYQKQVLSAVTGLEKSGVPEEMRAYFSAIDNGFSTMRKPPRKQAIPLVAALRIRKRLSALLSYDPWVLHPDAVAEHHATRIAAKKLRYTMEIYGAAYRNSLKKPLARIKKIQEILGDIHDCDVWIDQITMLLLRERTLLRSGNGAKRPDTMTLASLRLLLRERENERIRRYRQFVRYWQALSRACFWDSLCKTLDTGRKSAFRPQCSYHDDDAAMAADALAAAFPGIQSHSRHVTNLALTLFDALETLHNLDVHDRFLLRCAGTLHDIGWMDGRSGHNRRGAEMVFLDESLPFDLEERGILAFIVISHRGKMQIPASPYLAFVSQRNLPKARVLAAILRIADGLDYMHAGSVHGIHVQISPDSVTLTVTGTGDIAGEIARSQEKGDLFFQVFKKVLVVR